MKQSAQVIALTLSLTFAPFMNAQAAPTSVYVASAVKAVTGSALSFQTCHALSGRGGGYPTGRRCR